MVAVIGDIHGCYYTLVELYKNIKKKYKNIKVFTVGDLVDRGKYSCEVVNFVHNEHILFTPGNHDYMFVSYFKEPGSTFARSWIFNGNEATLESYEQHPEHLNAHLKFLRSAPLFFNLPDCFICHAGIAKYYEKFLPLNFKENIDILEPLIYEDYITDQGVLWTREPLLNIGKLQIVGHTKYHEITLDESANVLYIDTGACMGYRLSAVIIEKNKIIDVLDVKTNALDINHILY
ncbi:MAG: metallophosphoesterase [bacterium]